MNKTLLNDIVCFLMRIFFSSVQYAIRGLISRALTSSTSFERMD